MVSNLRWMVERVRRSIEMAEGARAEALRAAGTAHATVESNKRARAKQVTTT